MLIYLLIFMLGVLVGFCGMAVWSINRGEDEGMRKEIDERV